jgi:muramoyltetrapeptide carboxypeptidase
MIWPDPLEPGDTIMFIAPAGELATDPREERVLEARRRLEARGFRVVMREDLFTREGYLAGPDKRRAKELMQAFTDRQVRAVIATRGGYGTMRILDRLDYDKIRANPKILVGFSDITGLHLALNRRAGLVTFHGPTSFWGLDDPEEGMHPFTQQYLLQALAGEASGGNGYTIEIPAGAPRPVALGRGRARGRLAGGNLSMISALEGTPFAIDTRDAILLLEDTREAPYRIDRMLRQLQLAGKLQTLHGAVLGQFTRNYDREEDQMTEDPRFTVDGVLRQYFEPLGIPVLMNYPVGHSPYNATLPLGAQVEVDADRGTLRILPH